MKKVALTVAVLSLGLAACQDNAPDNNASVVNTIETEAEADVNAASNSADAALDAAGNELDATGNALENTGEAVDNAAENAN